MASNPYVNKVQYGNDTLMDLTNDTVEPDKVLQGYTFHDRSGAPQTGTAIAGHEMIPVTNDMAQIAGLTDGDDNYVLNAYSAKRWSNCDAIVLLTTATKETDTIGDWEDDWDESGASRSGWLWSADLYQVLEDGSGNPILDIEIIPVFEIGKSETISLYAYRIDDNIDQVISGQTVHGGAVAFKFTGKVQNEDGVKVGLKLVHQRTNVNNFTVLS